jgi:hypothetical protein
MMASKLKTPPPDRTTQETSSNEKQKFNTFEKLSMVSPLHMGKFKQKLYECYSD